MATSDAVVLENQKQGNPQSDWGLTFGAAVGNIEGYAKEFSVNLGETVEFKVNTDATDYRIDIYRLGYYNGDGARLVGTVDPGRTSAIQPAPLRDAATKLVDAGNWFVTDQWQMPDDLISGVYIAKLVREDGTFGESRIPFIVRDDASTSDIVFQTADSTWQAYNPWGGQSLYTGAKAVSYNRPFALDVPEPVNTTLYGPESYLFGAEYAAIRWLEKNGYNVTYQSGIDTSRFGDNLLNHDIFLSVGHDEYWTAEQRANVEAARDAGVNLSFWGGNDVFWKTRLDLGITGEPYKTLVTYKESNAGATPDPSGVWTGLWRDFRGADEGGGQPENALTGTRFGANLGTPLSKIEIPSDFSNFGFWDNTVVENLEPGTTWALNGNYLGYEWNVAPADEFRPAGLVELSSTTREVPYLFQDQLAGLNYAPGTATHNMTLYRADSGALVFSAGTVFWSWALDDFHVFGPVGPYDYTPTDPNAEQAMVNLFAQMGAQPGLLTWYLTPDQLDNAPPVTAVLAPEMNQISGFVSTIRGEAQDLGGGSILGVEVSLDAGATWSKASGTTNWSYSWVPSEAGPVSVMARATDDWLNTQIITPPQTVTINSSQKLNMFSWADGWGDSPDYLRMLVDIDNNGTSDYVGFGIGYTFVAFGGSWSDGKGNIGTGFGSATPLIQDLGTSAGYTSAAQRGVVDTGYGTADTIYGQNASGIVWYGATTATPQTDDAGRIHNVPQYETTAHNYAQFGFDQGWSDENGFDITFLSSTDAYASILGFGADGIIVAPQAFAPNATAADAYTIGIPVGNNSGWNQKVDIRTFVDNNGEAIDLNKDGVVDFVGMGPDGLVYAYGTIESDGRYQLDTLETAQTGVNFGRSQNWNEADTYRALIQDPETGDYNVFGFGSAGVWVSMGQDPSANGGQPFAPAHLAALTFNTDQGWSNDLTPRVIGDVNGDSILDIVGFGASKTFVALGYKDTNGDLYFAIDDSLIINDLGYDQNWDTDNTIRTLTGVDDSGRDALVISGAYGTIAWDLLA